MLRKGFVNVDGLDCVSTAAPRYIKRTNMPRIPNSHHPFSPRPPTWNSPPPPTFSLLPLEEPPPQENDYDESQRAKRPILLEHQFPIDSYGSPPILLTIIPQPRADLAHPLQTISAIEQILNILGHHFCHVAQLVIKLVKVLCGARIAVGRLGLGNEVVKLHKGVGPQGRVEQLGHRIHGGELGGEVREVGEGELARVGALGDAKVDNVRGDEVVDCVCAGLDGGLGFRVAVEAAEDELDLGFDFGEGCFCLKKESRHISAVDMGLKAKACDITYCLVVDGCAQIEA